MIAPSAAAPGPAAPPPASPADLRRLWLAALLVLLPAAGFAWRYPLPGNTERLTDIGKLAAYAVPEFAGYVGGLALMFAGYLWGLRLCGRLPDRRALPIVLAGGAAAALAIAWMYPVNAIDLFIYAARSRIFTEYGLDPMTVPPLRFPDDPLMRFASREWADNVSPYGPLWNLLAAPATALAGENVGLALAGLKALALAATVAGGLAIARFVVAERGEGAAQGALLFLWNPLVLWEGVGNGHNDVVMMLPVLLAFLAWARRDALVVPALVVAAAIKYVALALLPLAAIALWRREEARAEPAPAGTVAPPAVGRGQEVPTRGRLVAVSAGLSLLVLLVAFAPFYDPGAIRSSLADQGSIALTSPAAVAIAWLRERRPVAEARRWVQAATLALFAIGLAVALVRVWRRPAALPRAAFETTFVLLLVATWNFRPWYLIWLVGLAALLPLGWPAARTIAWSAGGLAGYALFIWGWEWWGAPFAAVQLAGVLLMTGPAVALTLFGLVASGASPPRSGAGLSPASRA